MQTERAWAISEFGDARLGDHRRKWRLIDMAAEVAAKPHGVVTSAFRSDASRQGAYDFLESKHVDAAAVEEAAGSSCAQRAARFPFVFVPIDGTGISLSDPHELKELGPIGGHDLRNCGRGMKAINAIALDPSGTPIGVAGQEFWTRPNRRNQTRAERRKADRRRPRHEKEIQRWTTVIKRIDERFETARATAWYVVDREGDAREILDALSSSRHFFTVRAAHDRAVSAALEKRESAIRPRHRYKQRHLRAEMSRRPSYARCEIDVATGLHRAARKARLVVRIQRLSLRMTRDDSHNVDVVPINVVWVREVATTPNGEQPLDWMLFTNHPIDTVNNVERVIQSYTQRWRIEDFHKTWKSGCCHVEQAQLRSTAALKKWATILAAVAARVERLKHLARSNPDLPASGELTPYELKAVVLLKRREKKRTEVINDDPTIALATRWIADLGGYTGKSSGGPPGSITIARGLERVRIAAAVIEELERK
jgi:hypothetical protein